MTVKTIGLIEQARQSQVALQAGLKTAQENLEAERAATKAAHAEVDRLTQDLSANNAKADTLKGKEATRCLEKSEKLKAELAKAKQKKSVADLRLLDARRRVELSSAAIQRDAPRETELTLKAAGIAREIKQLEATQAGDVSLTIASLESLWQGVLKLKRFLTKGNRIIVLLQPAEDALRNALIEAKNQTALLQAKRDELAKYGD